MAKKYKNKKKDKNRKVSFESPSMPKQKKKPDGVPDAPMFRNFVPNIY